MFSLCVVHYVLKSQVQTMVLRRWRVTFSFYLIDRTLRSMCAVPQPAFLEGGFVTFVEPELHLDVITEGLDDGEQVCLLFVTFGKGLQVVHVEEMVYFAVLCFVPIIGSIEQGILLLLLLLLL